MGVGVGGGDVGGAGFEPQEHVIDGWPAFWLQPPWRQFAVQESRPVYRPLLQAVAVGVADADVEDGEEEETVEVEVVEEEEEKVP